MGIGGWEGVVVDWVAGGWEVGWDQMTRVG